MRASDSLNDNQILELNDDIWDLGNRPSIKYAMLFWPFLPPLGRSKAVLFCGSE